MEVTKYYEGKYFEGMVGYQRLLKYQRETIEWKKSARWPGEPLQHWVGGV